MDIQSDTMKFSMMVTGICVVHLYACIQIIKIIVENEADGKRFSLLSLGFMVIWDIYICLFLLSSSLTDYEFFHYFITPAFWYFILASIFETRLISILWKIRYQDNFHTTSELRTGIISFYINFYGIMAILLVLAYSFIPETWFLFTSALFLLPQIAHNAIRGEKYKFNSNFIFGLGVFRIIIPMYAKTCPANIFELTPNSTFLLWYPTVLGLQIFILFLQSKFGSRFFIPGCLLPPKFNYYITRPLIGPGQENEVCPICMENLSRDQSEPSSALLKSPSAIVLMQTPCKHKFHTKCLQEWMRIKLDCPFCRQSIPALE